MVQEFMSRTKMIDKNGEKTGVQELVEYLCQPPIVYRMITASELNMPALTLIASDLEKKFNENSNFPVVIYKNNANATARQNVGRVIKFVMAQYGYEPVSEKLEERTRIPAIANSKYFSTCAVYAKRKDSKALYNIIIETRKAEKYE